MWLKDIIYRKYDLQGYNNPTDFFLGVKKSLKKREKGKKRIYFLGLPEHGNMGDQAIAIAMIHFVKQFEKYEILTFNASQLYDYLIPIKKDCKKEDIIILIGGGNMGIAYFDVEEIRRLAIEMFPDNRVIIFPQTIDFGKEPQGIRQLENTVKIYGKHRDLHIFAREQVSYEIMQSKFTGNRVYLTPDIVYSLPYQKSQERKQVLCCIRNDRESAISKADIPKVLEVIAKWGEVKRTDTVEAYVPTFTSDDIRKKMVYRKLDEFAKSKFVVTDRLHGMIFSVITGTPCVVFGNYNHKVKSSYKTWLAGMKNIVFAENVSELENAISSLDLGAQNKEELEQLRNEFEPMRKLFD